MDNTERVGLSGEGYWAEVCACGHALSRHALVGTEYCRCESYPGECPCSGGARVALLVFEGSAANGVATNTKFFRRQFRVDGDHPLNGGVRKTRDSGIDFEWAAVECDYCGQEWAEDFVAFWAGSDGEPSVELTEVTGRTLLLCGLCCVEMEWKASDGVS